MTNKALNESRFKLSEHAFNRWFVTAETGTTIEEILHRDYWRHIARNLRPYDEIRVAIDSGDWLLVLHVASAGATWANVVELQRFESLKAGASAVAQDEGEGLHVDWRGPHARFAVMRKSDGNVVKDKFQDRALAEEYIRNSEGAKV
ncbi:hypothetical protein [Methylocapsa aurea]|uniref:hypothetical protein n=1 Tax=Methylocapsa aurea TaxID=663610 RepID=UPI0005683BE9|nr:hypothetical protein [Methylocapsa aurea]